MRRIIFGVVTLVVVIGVIVAGSLVLFGRNSKDAKAIPTATPEPNPVTAEGIVVAAKLATLSFGAGGPVTELPVELGTLVRAGTVLAMIDPAEGELQVRSARNELQARRAALQQLLAGPRQEEIDSLKAAVNTARAQLGRIEAAVDGDEQIARAQLDSARARLVALSEGPTAADLAIADAQLASAVSRLKALQDGPSLADLALADAAVVTAQSRLSAIEDGPNPADLAIADSALASARARLAALMSGPRIEDVRSAESQVDQAKARFDAAREKAQGGEVIAAEASLSSAQARLSQAKAGPTKADIAVAQAAVDTAENSLAQIRDGATIYQDEQSAQLEVQRALTSLDRARAVRDTTASTVGIKSSQITTADADVRAAELLVQIAQNNLAKVRSGATPWSLRQAEISVEQAKARLRQVTDPRAFDVQAAEAALSQGQGSLLRIKAAIESEIALAESNLAQAQASLDRLLTPTATDVEIARQGVRQAEAQRQKLLQPTANDLEIARQGVRQAEAQKQKLLEPTANDLEAARQSVKQAEAQRARLFSVSKASDVASAQAAVDQAQANLDRLLATRPHEIAAAREGVAQARAQLELRRAPATKADVGAANSATARAETALAQAIERLNTTKIKAPFAGTVAEILLHIGERANPGVPAITLVDLPSLVIETRDLDENGVARVAVGQAVKVTVHALDQTLEGNIIRIDPLGATISSGDTMYTATIALQNDTLGLRPGMSTKVDFVAALEAPLKQGEQGS